MFAHVTGTQVPRVSASPQGRTRRHIKSKFRNVTLRRHCETVKPGGVVRKNNSRRARSGSGGDTMAHSLRGIDKLLTSQEFALDMW